MTTWSRWVVASATAAVVLVIGCLVFSGCASDDYALSPFEARSADVLSRAETLATRAVTFEDEKALSTLTPNPLCGFYYRFDDNVAAAQFKAADPPEKRASHQVLHSAELPADEIEFRPMSSSFREEGGILSVDHRRGDVLFNVTPLSVNARSIAEVELRLKLDRTKALQLGWSDSEEATAPGAFGAVTVYTIPDGQFHTYRVNAKALPKRMPGEPIVKRFFLRPSRNVNDKVEIEYVRLVRKRDKYEQEKRGEGYEEVAGEMRMVLYAVSPGSLRYSVQLPDGDTYLHFGMAILEDEPVEFSVVLRDGREATLLRERVESSAAWRDTKLDVSKWAGRKVEIEFSAESNRGNVAFWSNPILYQRPKTKLNVIFIVQDALRADHLSAYGYDRRTSPRTDAFIKRGVLFENAFSQASKTRPSVPSYMTGMFPTATGVWGFSNVLDDNYLTLAEILRSQGFATGSFLQNGNAGPYAGLHQGFETLRENFSSGKDLIHRANDVLGEELNDWIERNADRNFFAYIHLIDPHGPYDPPPPYDEWYRSLPASGNPLDWKSRVFDPDWVQRPTVEGRRRLYDGEIAYNDEHLGKFIERLNEMGLLDRTLVILSADHGEHLGEHGLWEHVPPGYTEVLHVPLVMVMPGTLPLNRRVSEAVQLVDIVPTVLDLVKVDGTELLLQGDSLVPLIRGDSAELWKNRVVISDEVIGRNKADDEPLGSIFFRQWHVLRSRAFPEESESGKREYRREARTLVFDYHDDPLELGNETTSPFGSVLREKSRVFLEKLQRKNRAIWKAMTRQVDKTIQVDPETQERLRALGYLD